MIAIFGGGDIATNGIIPVVGGQIAEPCDVTSFTQVELAIAGWRPEIVINCAGISIPADIATSDPRGWEHELRVNLLGSYHVAKAALDHDVSIMIFLASVAGLHGKPQHGGYSASKAGVISLVQSLAMEGHHAYAISPGRVDTRMREHDYPGEDPRTRLGPTQIGEVVGDILAGHYEPGDNILIRKIGYETFLRVDRGEPWRSYLRVGEPAVC